jgi:hypothetical protein
MAQNSQNETKFRVSRDVNPEEKLSKDSEYVIHEEVRVNEENMKVDAASHKTITDIVKEGKEIFKKVKKAKVDILDSHGKDALYSKLSKEHKDFVKALPIPFQRLVYLDEFSPKVLHRFLKCNKQLFWKNEEAWLNSMAGYIVDLFKEKNPHASETNVSVYRQSVFKSLKKDSDDFKEKYEDVKKEVENLEQQRKIDAQNKLKLLLKNYAKKS